MSARTPLRCSNRLTNTHGGFALRAHDDKRCRRSNLFMANIPENLRYSKDHEWIAAEGETATIGITDYAQHSLGDVVYTDMPRFGDMFGADESLR